MPESKKLTSFPAQIDFNEIDQVNGVAVVIVEVHDNGYAYVRAIRADDVPGFNDVPKSLEQFGFDHYTQRQSDG